MFSRFSKISLYFPSSNLPNVSWNPDSNTLYSLWDESVHKVSTFTTISVADNEIVEESSIPNTTIYSNWYGECITLTPSELR